MPLHGATTDAKLSRTLSVWVDRLTTYLTLMSLYPLDSF
jgi:hypothetical protein